MKANDSVEPVAGPVTGTEPVFVPLVPPNGERIVVNVGLALEAWAGTASTGSPISGLSEKAKSMGVPDWAAVSSQDYGGRTGIWRLLDVLEETGVKATCSTSTLVAERWPETVKALVDRGHQIVTHGYSQDGPIVEMNAEEDKAVVEGLGARKQVSMPRTDEVNDMALFRRHGNSPDMYVDYFKRAFDQIYKEGTSGSAKVVTCMAHATIMGRPWAVSALVECIEYARRFDDAWITTKGEVVDRFLISLES